MKQIIFPGPGHIELQDRRDPSLPRGFVRVLSQRSLISNGTELTILHKRFASGTHWDRWVRFPFSPGYAMIGSIVETNIESSFSVGQQVALRSPHASQHIVKPTACIPIPSTVVVEQAMWFSLSRIAFIGTQSAQITDQEIVLIVGGGPVAQLAIRWAALSKPRILAAIVRRPISKTAAVNGGATVVLEGSTNNYSAALIKKALGGRPDVILDCTGNSDVFSWSLSVSADYGRVVLIGDSGYPNEQRLTSDVVTRGIRISGVHDSFSHKQWNEYSIANFFFSQVVSGAIDLTNLCTHTFLPHDASIAYGVLDSRDDSVIGVSFDWTYRGLPRL